MTDITLLDGGMGQELVNRSGDTPTPLWGTQVMVDHPGMVEAIHSDYFDAGATIAGRVIDVDGRPVPKVSIMIDVGSATPMA